MRVVATLTRARDETDILENFPKNLKLQISRGNMDGREHVRRGGLRRAVKETTRYVGLYGVIFSGLSETSGQTEIVVCRAFTEACLSRQAASSRFHCCFAGIVDFRADLRQCLRMNEKKTAKNAGGRPRGSRLDRPEYQRLLSLAIARSGKPENCWQGICSVRSFLNWKKRNRKTWESLRDGALKEHALQASLSSPDILEKAMSRLREKIDANELNARELLETVKYFDGRRNEMK